MVEIMTYRNYTFKYVLEDCAAKKLKKDGF